MIAAFQRAKVGLDWFTRHAQHYFDLGGPSRRPKAWVAGDTWLMEVDDTVLQMPEAANIIRDSMTAGAEVVALNSFPANASQIKLDLTDPSDLDEVA